MKHFARTALIARSLPREAWYLLAVSAAFLLYLRRSKSAAFEAQLDRLRATTYGVVRLD